MSLCRNVPIIYHEQRMGTATPCVLTSMLEATSEIKDAPPQAEEYIRNTAGAAFGAASDTARVMILPAPPLSLIFALDTLDNNELYTWHGFEPGGTAEGPRRA